MRKSKNIVRLSFNLMMVIVILSGSLFGRSRAEVIVPFSLAPPARTSPGETLIDFENLPANTVIEHQYDKQGVSFGAPVFLPLVVEVPAGQAQSGNHVINITCGSPCTTESPLASAAGTFIGGTKRHVKVFVGAFSGQSNEAAQLTMVARNSQNLVVAQSPPVTVVPGAGFHTPLEVSASSAEIASFEVTARPSEDVRKQIGLDDLTFDAGTGTLPDFSFSAATSVTLLQASARPLSITINRLNGSTGGIQFAAGNLPTGVSATFSPSTVTVGATTLTLSAAPNAPVTTMTATLTATPVSASAGAQVRTLLLPILVRPNYTVFMAGAPTIDLAPCTPVQTTIKVTRDFGFNGSVDLHVDGLPINVQATFTPPTLAFKGGILTESSNLTLSLPPGVTVGSSNVTVRASSGALPESTATLTVRGVAGHIDSFNPISGRTPQALKSGTQLVIRGAGFCSGSTVRFGNALAEAVPVSISGDGTALTVRVPRLATDGRLTVSPPNQQGITSNSDFIVDSYRNTAGFSFRNYSQADYNFDDLTDVFGFDQTHVTVDFCFGLGCKVTLPIPDPLTLVLMGIANKSLKNGQCFGIAEASQRLLHKDVPFGAFPLQNPATTVWNLVGDKNPSPPLKHYIHLQHLSQLSAEALHWWLTNTAANSITQNSAVIRAQVANLLAAGQHPLISLHSGSDGHAVVAYDLEDDGFGAGGFYIYVYDSNDEFKAAENDNGSLHQGSVGIRDSNDKEAGSRIHVTPGGGWSFPNLSWSGDLDALVVYHYGVIPLQPTIPTSLSGLGTIVFGASQTEQISDSSGHTLLRADHTLNTEPANSLPLAARFTPLTGTSQSSDFYLLGGAGPYTQTIHGTESGLYSNVVVGLNSATELETTSDPNIGDRITLEPSRAGLAFHTDQASKPVTVKVHKRAADRSTRSAILHTTSFMSGDDSIAFDASDQSVTYHHSGAPTSYQLDLGWTGRQGAPVIFKCPTLNIAPDDTVTLRPASWEALNTEPVTLIVTHENGRKEELSLRSQAAQIGSFGISSIRVRPASCAGKVISIRSQFAGLPYDATVVISFNVTHAGRPAGHHVITMPASKIRIGKRIDRWDFVPESHGRYFVKGSITVIKGGELTSSQTTTQSLSLLF